MKKLLLNPCFLHVFYGVMLLIISALLWLIYPSPRECRQAESSTKTMEDAFEIIQIDANFLKTEIDEFIKAYNSYHNQFGQNTTNISIKKSDSLLQIIDTIQKELRVEMNKNFNFLYHKYSTFPSRKILTNNKIQQMKRAFDTFEDTAFVNRFDPRDWKVLQPQLLELKNQIAWNDLGSLSAVSADAQLQVMKLTTAEIKIMFLNYLRVKYGSCTDLKFDKFAIMVSPEASFAKVGEPFRVNLNLYNYASNLDSNYHIICDGVELPIHDGVAHCEKVFNRAGKHTILATASYKNPLTGQTEASKKEYNIEVLPK